MLSHTSRWYRLESESPRSRIGSQMSTQLTIDDHFPKCLMSRPRFTGQEADLAAVLKPFVTAPSFLKYSEGKVNEGKLRPTLILPHAEMFRALRGAQPNLSFTQAKMKKALASVRKNNEAFKFMTNAQGGHFDDVIAKRIRNMARHIRQAELRVPTPSWVKTLALHCDEAALVVRDGDDDDDDTPQVPDAAQAIDVQDSPPVLAAGDNIPTNWHVGYDIERNQAYRCMEETPKGDWDARALNHAYVFFCMCQLSFVNNDVKLVACVRRFPGVDKQAHLQRRPQ